MKSSAIRVFTATAVLVTLSFCGLAQTVKRGFSDLSNHSFETDGAVKLSGVWEFYWNQLLTPADFSHSFKPEWVSVPGSWHRQDYPTLGFATYRLRLRLPGDQQGVSLYFPIINCAAKIWLNGELVSQSGVVSDRPEGYTPRLEGTVVSIPDKTQDIELIIQAANFTYFSGGIAGTPRLEKESAIVSSLNRTNGIENFFAGSLIAMFVYQLILYFLYHRGKPHLWLALICLGVALRALIVHGGSFLLPNLFPIIDWESWKKIEFGSVYAIVALFPLYVYHLFIDYAPKRPLYLFVGLSTGLGLAVLYTSQHMYGRLLEICHMGLIGGFIYAVYSIGRAWRAGNSDAKTILFGVLASFPFILAEILKNSLLFPLHIEFMYLVELGVLVFLLFQVYLLANHYAKAYRNLETMNQNLERVVAERTGELVTANAVKDRLLSVVSHDIKSPLNSLRGILQIFNMGGISQDEMKSFTQQIESDLGKTGMLVENILYWTASQLKGVRVKKEQLDVRLLVDENVQLLKTLATKKNITLITQVTEFCEVVTDRNILNLVLRNLISNAIKFSFENGEIKIQARLSETDLILQVIDYGVGMDNDTLQKLLTNDAESSLGTGNEKGTGLGLSLCREYLQKAGGQLTIESAINKGSTFTIILPIG